MNLGRLHLVQKWTKAENEAKTGDGFRVLGAPTWSGWLLRSSGLSFPCHQTPLAATPSSRLGPQPSNPVLQLSLALVRDGPRGIYLLQLSIWASTSGFLFGPACNSQVRPLFSEPPSFERCFLDRREGREKNMARLPLASPQLGRGLQVRGRGTEQVTFRSQAGAQPTEPRQPGL